MKKLLCILLLITACKKMDDNYKKYIVEGGIIYPGKALSPVVYPGNNRAKISWLRGSDPKVVKARIFWNNNTDSVEVLIPEKTDTVSYTFEQLPENEYSFMIRTYDDAGNVSVPVEVSGSVFGEKYQAGLLNRAVNASELFSDGSLSVSWGAADTATGAVATQVRYINAADQTVVQWFSALEGESLIQDFKSGFEYRTLYLPDSLAIDTFYTAYEFQQPTIKIPKHNWIATANSYEASGQLPNGPPEKVLDDNDQTYWHSRHTSALTGYPHWLAFDMLQPVAVSRVELSSRPDYFREDFTKFIIQGSMDGITWTDYGSFDLPDQAGPQSFSLVNTPVMKHIRIYMTQGVTIHAHLAEFSVYGNYQ